MTACIACGHPALYGERTNPSRTFCGLACQRRLMVGLKTETVDDHTVVGLESSDGQRFEADVATLAPLRTIVNLLEDAGPDCYIPLPAVNGEALSTIMALLRGQMDFSALDSLDDRRYFALTLACNYIEYQSALGYLLGGLIARFMALDDATFAATIGRPYKDLLLAACMFPPKDQAAAFHRRFVAHFGMDTFSDTFQKPVRAFLDSRYVSGFMWAAISGRTALVALLLASPMGPERGIALGRSADNNEAIRWAARNGYAGVVTLLLAEPRERGINPAADNNWAIRAAATRCDVVALVTPCGNDSSLISYKQLFPEHIIKPTDYKRLAPSPSVSIKPSMSQRRPGDIVVSFSVRLLQNDMSHFEYDPELFTYLSSHVTRKAADHSRGELK